MQAEQQLTFGSYRFDPQTGQLWRGKQEVRLTLKATTVLRYLVERAGQVVTKDDLFAAAWPDTVVSDAALTTCIQEVRQALHDDARRPRYIETVHRRGFRFLPAVTTQPVSSSTLQVPNHEGVASNQNSVGSRGEENHTARDETDPESSGQSREEVASSQNSVGSRQAQERQKPVLSLVEGATEGDTGQAEGVRLQSAGSLPFAPPTRFWPSKGLLLIGLLLLVGVIFTVQYLSLLTPNPQPPTPTPQPALPLPDKPSIVVLPFTNLSGDPGQDYFSDGLTDVLTGHLSRISSLFVIARNSAFTYKGKAVKVQEVSKELGVRYVVEGSVQKADQRVRITAQLIDATTGFHLWSEQYDRPLQDLFTLQDEIVQRIVTTLKLQLTLQEQGMFARKHTDNLDAYDACLRGAEYFLHLTKEATTIHARQMYEKAIALDPQYADAYVGLGGTYVMEWNWRWSMNPQTLDRAEALAQKALTLDDSLPGAHSLLSWVYMMQQQYDQAIAEGERAIALDPNNAYSYAMQANVMTYASRPAEALQAVTQAMRFDPRYPPFYLVELGMAYWSTGRYAEAITTLKEAISRNPNIMATYVHLAHSYLLQWGSQQNPAAQTLEPAVVAAQRALALSDSLHWSHTRLGFLYLNQQQHEQALAEMERAVALDPTEAMSYAALAVGLSCMGRTEDALEAAAQALRLKAELAVFHLADVGTAYAVAGRYEEARAPLQRFLSHYPNLLPSHLMLAVVYSELGQAAEAQAEAAEVLRLNPDFSLEVHRQRTPIKDSAVLERHIAALRKGGTEINEEGRIKN